MNLNPPSANEKQLSPLGAVLFIVDQLRAFGSHLIGNAVQGNKSVLSPELFSQL